MQDAAATSPRHALPLHVWKPSSLHMGHAMLESTCAQDVTMDLLHMQWQRLKAQSSLPPRYEIYLSCMLCLWALSLRLLGASR